MPKHVVVVLAVATLLIGGCQSPEAISPESGPPQAHRNATPATVSETPQGLQHRSRPHRVVAVGDVACSPKDRGKLPCRDVETAQLARSLNPEVVISLGDQQYQSGSLAEFEQSYDNSWGKLLELTRPVPGNHEYRTPGAAGYYQYFSGQQPGPPGYYTYQVGKWRIYALNSNCDKIDCSTQTSWLNAQMDKTQVRCSMIVMHHPLITSGVHGPIEGTKELWQVAFAHSNDLVLAAHDHTYERFAPLRPNTSIDLERGMTQFIVGTGGKNLYPKARELKQSRVFSNSDFGVLELVLRTSSYRWRMLSTSGKTIDRGSADCH